MNEVMPGLCWFSATERSVFIKTLQAAHVKFLICAVCTEISILTETLTDLHPCCALTG